jgi:predicted PurR-regulated permease PerM
MKVGTVVLLIVLIFLTAFASLGYLYSQFSVLQQSNEQLQQENAQLHASLAEAEGARQADQKTISELTTQMQELKGTLARTQSERQQFEEIVAQCQTSQGLGTTFASPGTLRSSLYVGSATLLIAGYGLLKRFRIADQRIVLRMTREQLNDYIRYQRGAPRK